VTGELDQNEDNGALAARGEALTPIELSSLRRDGGCQPRAQLDDDVVVEYAEAMEAGADFPPVKVFHDGTAYWLVDGYHRVAAAERLERETVNADIIQGNQRDAILHSCGANREHGLRRTNEDKRRAVRRLLEDEEWGKQSDSWIAKACGVSQPFVSVMRHEVAPSYNASEMRIVTRGGTTYGQNTAQIGRRPRRPKEEVEAEKARKAASAEQQKEFAAQRKAHQEAAVTMLLVAFDDKDLLELIEHLEWGGLCDHDLKYAIEERRPELFAEEDEATTDTSARDTEAKGPMLADDGSLIRDAVALAR
jgi:hypothetical protein